MNELQRPHSSELARLAKEGGRLSEKSMKALQLSTVSREVENALENTATIGDGGPVTLVTMMPDDSGSMFSSLLSPPNRYVGVVQGHNELLASLKAGAEFKRTLLQTRLLNGRLINRFSPVKNCIELDQYKYQSGGGTPLFMQTLFVLATVVMKTEELEQRGSPVNSATLLMTDGEATDWSELAQSQVAGVVADMRAQGSHIIAGMGIGNPLLYKPTFIRMGIDPDLVYPATSREEILKIFRTFGEAAHSQAIVLRH